MVWTKLLRVRNVNKAMKFAKDGKRTIYPLIKERYRDELIREFESRDLPWLYEGKPAPRTTYYDSRPRVTEKEEERRMKIEDIKERLANNDAEVYAYRREMINNRKYGGFARIAKEFFPSWISKVKKNNKGGDNQERP